MVFAVILGGLALVSLALTLWQFLAGSRFALHARMHHNGYAPSVTLLKPLKGADSETRSCLASWLEQKYTGPWQVQIAVSSEDDPVVPIVRELLATHPQVDAELVICSESLGANAKVSKLAQIARRARNEILVVSDADTRVTPDFLTNVVLPLKDPDAGLVNCFYRLANPVTVAMRWEALAVNADFWTHVLQSRHLKPIDFALGAVMAMRREELATIGGFEAIVDYLADDYQLGNRIARAGKTIALCPVTVECRSAPHGWHHVWSHQLRWARTIRVCQPWPYFLSVLGNASFWPLLWVAVAPTQLSLGVSAICLLARVVTAQINEARLTGKLDHLAWGWLIPVKDLLQFGIWAASFTGSRVEWRGVRYQVLIGGKLVRES